MQVVYVDTDSYRFSSKDKSRISRVLHRSSREVKERLPQLSSHLTVVVEPVIQGNPTALSAHLILARITLSPNSVPGWERKLKQTMYHEGNHAARFAALPRPSDLLDLCVGEGLAMTFERDCCGSSPPWDDEEDVPFEQWLQELKAAAKDPAATHESWFVKHPDGRHWIGYRVGVYLVDLAQQNHPGVQASDLVVMTTQQILDLAGV